MAAAAAGTRRRDPFEEKLFRVTLWLKKIFGNERIPEYEVNERTVDILHEVMECNEERDKDVLLLIEDMKDRAAKYKAEAKYWQEILGESLGLSEGSLSQEATADLADLVESAMALEVENTSLTSFYSAINSMTSELYETKSKNQEMERKLNTLTKKLTSAVTMEKHLEEDLKKLKESQEAEKAKAAIRSTNLKFLEDKTEDIKIRISNAEGEIVAAGLDQSLTHEALMKLSEELAALLKGIKPLKEELASYRDLPPDTGYSALKMQDSDLSHTNTDVLPLEEKIKTVDRKSIPLARVKVEEARQELKALDEELSREIEAVPFELT